MRKPLDSNQGLIHEWDEAGPMIISYPEAQGNAQRACQTKRVSENCTLAQAIGRVSAQNVMAPFAVQPFDNAAMDGYAVHSQDLAGATSSNPILLSVTGSISAGDLDIKCPRTEKTCIRIMTGAPIPEGYNAVVPFEEAQLCDDKAVSFLNPVKTGT